jgi:hypothetical protein
MLIDAGRAYPPIGDGSAPKVIRVASTHGNGVATESTLGAEPGRRVDAPITAPLKAASAARGAEGAHRQHRRGGSR